MKPTRLLPIIAIASLLGACAGQAQNENVAEVRALPQKGDEFHVALHREYVALAQIEFDEHHYGATRAFNQKAREAAANNLVLPTRLDERTIPTANVQDLTVARGKLMSVLDANGAERAPQSTARAQTQFDCWMEEQEEDIQSQDILLCRNGFENALKEASDVVFAAVEQPVIVVATPAPTPAQKSETFTLYFDHDSSTLNDNAIAVKNQIGTRANAMKAKSVTVKGYTDRSGTRDYNDLLAERRAATVATALVANGVKPAVGSLSYGEDRLAVQTMDDVREWHNRRVTVTLIN